MSFVDDIGKYQSNIALIDQKNCSLTYGELEKEIAKLAKILNCTGKKSLIFVLAKNNIPSVIAYLAGLKSKTVVMLLESGLPDAFLQKLVDTYTPEFIFREIKKNKKERLLYENEGFGLYKTKHNSQQVIHADLSLLLSTSGSTGSPKQVRLSTKNLQANAESIVNYLPINESERAITSLPMSYSYGLSIINSHLLVGASILLTDHSVMTKEFWRLLNKYRVSSLAGVPYTYDMFRRINPFRQVEQQLNYMTQAGGKLKPSMASYFARECKKNNVKFFIMYGQTEATARMSYLSPEKVASYSDSIGRSIPGGRFELLSEDGRLIENTGQPGELCYYGPNVMLGYAQARLDLQLGDELHGRLKTGDIAEVDEEKRYYIVGRIKRFIKIAGKRISLDQVEKYLHEQGVDVYCDGEDECLKVVANVEDYIEKIKKIIFNAFEIHHSMIQFYYVEVIPKNNAGKTMYKKLFEEAKLIC